MFKKDWSRIDTRVALFSDEDAESYEKLVELLKTPLKNDLDSDLYIIRGMLCWLKYNIRQHPRNIGEDSPLGLAADLYMNSSTKDYAEAFTKLCRKAGIECQTVEGIAKSDNFEPGDFQVDKVKMKSFWNKVFLSGSWWPVHPYFCLKQSGSEGTKISTCVVKKGQANINDFWFLTQPEIFIIKFFPDDPKNQLLPNSLTLKRSRQFMKLPFVTPCFFKYGLKLTSEESCIIDTKDGQAKLSFIVDKAYSKLIFNYSLQLEDAKQNSDVRADTMMANDLRKLVFMSRKKRRVTFEIRCPNVGTYRFVIRGKYPNEPDENILLKAKIVCREQMSDFRPLPIDAGFIGWGFGPRVFETGLCDPQVKIPKVSVTQLKSDEQVLYKRCFNPTDITFEIKKEALKTMSYTAELYSANKSNPLTDCVRTTCDKAKCELRISVTPPADEVELALVIEARDKHSQFEPICNYLITALEEKENVEEDYYDSSDGTSDLDEEIDQLEVTKKKLENERDRWLRTANRKDKSSSTEPIADEKDNEKKLMMEHDDRPLIVYMIEVVLAVFAVFSAVLNKLTGAVDRL